MASIRKEVIVKVSAEMVWAKLRDLGRVADLFPGMLTDSRLENERSRIVTFSGGSVIKEHIVDLDNAAKRLVYSAESTGLTHHNASMQILAETERSCRFIWVSDFLPDEAIESIGQLIDGGTRSFEKYWTS
ncbi:MAG: SRPBCC family protein [Sphingosinicella sp.]|nr:SRPBCC family protein [Sphingosinicella sp.]